MVPATYQVREATIRELKAILHRLLAELRGQDLGAKPDAWQAWRNTVVRESLPGLDPSYPSEDGDFETVAVPLVTSLPPHRWPFGAVR